ncbi:MAG TPA: histidine kinase [Candidatus Cybelea sp.]|nr:histidine kinase [Candidatus Cybelea sp.]
MHPLLTRNRLGLYLLGWIPLAAIVVLLMSAGGNLTWLESALIVVPLCVLYAFICLSAWYTAKSLPIRGESALRLIGVHTLAAALVSYFWMGLGWVLVAFLGKTSAFQGLDRRFAPQAPILFGAGYLLYSLAVASHYVILSLEASRQAEARMMEVNILARDAELKALKAQINPHFLFNSLNSISALTSIDSSRAREMCVLLGDFLRLTLGLGEKTAVRFSEELDLLEKYMAIEKVRFGDRLRMQETIQEDSKTCLLPPLLLQPLVENAVKHGIASLPEGGEIRLAAERQNGRLAIVVENSWDPEAPPRRSGGRGLENVQRRLEARYGKDASLRVNTEGELFQVSLSLPAESGESA